LSSSNISVCEWPPSCSTVLHFNFESSIFEPYIYLNYLWPFCAHILDCRAEGTNVSHLTAYWVGQFGFWRAVESAGAYVVCVCVCVCLCKGSHVVTVFAVSRND
jgi:hypothetical protein